MYNMKKKLILFYASEKEARYYLRHMNYGFVLTQNREGQQMLVENIPQLPRVALDNIGILHKVEMPAEQQEKRFLMPTQDTATNNLFLADNPPAMPVPTSNYNQALKNRRILFSTNTSSGLCNLQQQRVHPYARPQNDIIRLNSSCTMPSNNNSNNNTFEIPQIPNNFIGLPPLMPQNQEYLQQMRQLRQNDELELQRLKEFQQQQQQQQLMRQQQQQQQQLYTNNNLTISDLGENRCEMPSTSRAAVNLFDENSTDNTLIVNSALNATEFRGKANVELDNAVLANIVEKKIKINPEQYVQMANTEEQKRQNLKFLYQNYNDPELMYNKKNKMILYDGKLRKLHTFSVNGLEVTEHTTDWPVEQYTLKLPTIKSSTNTWVVNINSKNDNLLLNRTEDLRENHYIISSMNRSKIIMPSYFRDEFNTSTKYFLPPPQGFLYNNATIFPVFNSDPELREMEFHAIPPYDFYTKSIDMNFDVNSNYMMTPITNIGWTKIKNYYMNTSEHYDSYRGEIDYVKSVVNAFYQVLFDNMNLDFYVVSPTFFVRKLEQYSANFGQLKANTIFENVGFEIFLHLFEILKTDVHRQFGFGSIAYSLLTIQTLYSSVLKENPEFFGINITEDNFTTYRYMVETISSIYTCALYEHFENQPAPITYCNFFLPFSIDKSRLNQESVDMYAKFQQKFPRGRCFDTMAVARTNLINCDLINTYYWEILGKYAYVCNIVESLLYLDTIVPAAKYAEDVHPLKRPFPFKYLLGRPVINVYILSVPHIVQIHQLLASFVLMNNGKSLVDQIANGEDWSRNQRIHYNTRGINLDIIQSDVFIRVDETPFSVQLQQRQ